MACQNNQNADDGSRNYPEFNVQSYNDSKVEEQRGNQLNIEFECQHQQNWADQGYRVINRTKLYLS